MLEHPDIACAQRTGWPVGAKEQNEDTAESRREFAEEHIKEFLDFALAGDGSVLDSFAVHYAWKYKSWLN